MSKKKESSIPASTREDLRQARIDERMAERVRMSRTEEAKYEATLDPRQRVPMDMSN